MKQFRLLGMAVAALVLSIGFVACSSSDDDDDNNKTTVEKKLMSISEDDGEDESSITNFVYGTDGKLIKTTGKYNVNFSWNGNTIILTSQGEEPDTITLKDGKIFSANTVYTGNCISKFLNTYGNTEFTWQEGNIIQTVEEDLPTHDCFYYTSTYYTDKINKHPIFDFEGLRLTNIFSSDYGDLLLMAHPELLGTSNKNLIKSVTETNKEHSYTDTTNYTYEFDADGYPTKITETEVDSDDEPSITVYTLTWK